MDFLDKTILLRPKYSVIASQEETGNIMITKLLLVELCLTFATSINIQQDFPSSDSYRCPGGPTLRLKCEFAPGAKAVSWSFGGTIITVGYPGHEINNAMIASGVSYLSVNLSSDLRDSYHCIALFQDRQPQERTIEDFPEPANMNMKCSPGEINASSIQIKWNNTFPGCFNFSVWVNGSMIRTEGADEPNYSVVIDALSSNCAHNVCVVAQDGFGRTNKNWTHCDSIATAPIEGMKSCFCFDSIIGILLCILIPVLIAICLLVALTVCLALMCKRKRFCCHKAGKVENENQWPAGRMPVDMQKQTTNRDVDQI